MAVIAFARLWATAAQMDEPHRAGCNASVSDGAGARRRRAHRPALCKSANVDSTREQPSRCRGNFLPTWVIKWRVSSASPTRVLGSSLEVPYARRVLAKDLRLDLRR